MKYLVIVLALMMGLVSIGFDGWDTPPNECDPANREVTGNTNTPCKRVMPPLTRVEYRVSMYYPVCREEMVFHVEDIGHVDASSSSISIVNRHGNRWIWDYNR